MLKKCFMLISFFIAFSIHGHENDQQIEIKGITFTWKISRQQIHITLKARTKGWISIGFDPSRKMKDANYIIGAVDQNQVIIEDHFGVGLTMHALDTKLGGKSDIIKAAGSEKNGYTEISFTIPLMSHDQYDVPLTPGKHKVLLAYGATDNFNSKHIMIARTEIMIK